jgi:hypothetical protein
MFGVRRAPSAVPHRGQAVAAINIAVPTTRWTVQSVEDKLAQHVQVAATSISKAKSRGTHAQTRDRGTRARASCQSIPIGP